MLDDQQFQRNVLRDNFATVARVEIQKEFIQCGMTVDHAKIVSDHCTLQLDIIPEICHSIAMQIARYYPKHCGDDLLVPNSWQDHFVHKHSGRWFTKCLQLLRVLPKEAMRIRYEAEAHFPNTAYMLPELKEAYHCWALHTPEDWYDNYEDRGRLEDQREKASGESRLRAARKNERQRVLAVLLQRFQDTGMGEGHVRAHLKRIFEEMEGSGYE